MMPVAPLHVTASKPLEGQAVIAVAIFTDEPERASFVVRWATEADRRDMQGRRNAQSGLLARAALRALLAHQTGRLDWQIVRASTGKPSVIDAAARPGPAISLSHTRGMVAVALAADGVLGIDVEQHQPRDFNALAASAFGMSECAEVATGGADAFYRIWTLREAIAKATGEGLAAAANRRDLLTRDGCGAAYRSSHTGRVWHLQHVFLAGAYSLAIAHADTAAAALQIKWVESAAFTAGPVPSGLPDPHGVEQGLVPPA